MLNRFPYYQQLDTMDCGPSCLRMIAKYYGKSYSLQNLREKCFHTRQGVSLLGISEAAEVIGFRTLGIKIDFEKLKKESPTPLIAHWKQRHFVVVYGFKNDKVMVADPARGLLKITEDEFRDGWLSSTENGKGVGIALALQPTPDFYAADNEKLNKTKLSFFFHYLRPYKRFVVQLMLGMLVGSLLQLIFPFLTQAVVDFGIQNQNLDFVVLIMIAQVMLFFSSTAIGFIRGWILLHLGARINISLLSDFLIKLMKLPLSFFDTKMIGDLLQRIDDHKRIESLLTSSSLEIIFSIVNLFVFSIVLIIYDLQIFSIYIVGSVLYVTWIMLFLKKRKDLDYRRFEQMSKGRGNMIQLLSGMQEIKLQNSEKQKRWEWERIQAKLFKVSMSSLSLSQYQAAGSSFINEFKNFIISFLAAKSVINGDITLGMMMAIQYIIGQLNGPVSAFVGFIHAIQDAKISLERLGEIHNSNDEEDPEKIRISQVPKNTSLELENISFQYGGPHSEFALKDVNLIIPAGKITAIVGTSGSGKTTLLKLLLRFYEPTQGKINLGNISLASYSNRMWREQCGAVMQDGFIFGDTIAKNVAVSDEHPDKEKLLYAAKVANIHGFIESLPLGYNTKIGSEGVGLSEGQKQRILIARAVYKDPNYIFFDEATNALDANNEKMIMENLSEFYNGRTVIIVAHRLSTVKNADQVVVLHKGKITEVGTHSELTKKQGDYFKLVKNQLELGN